MGTDNMSYLFTVYVWIHITLKYINSSRLLNYIKKAMSTYLLSLVLLFLKRDFPYENINMHYLCKELYTVIQICPCVFNIDTH